MLKVLIIDDEKLVRQMVMNCLDWEEIGLQIIGEASSARMGQEMINELHPDIVFMDVRMPGMNGLECSKLILEEHPYIKILILSGHGEFEYASEAIKIGVFDYLLKPINVGELREAAIKVRDAVLEERDHQKEFEKFRKELEDNAGYIRDRQLSLLVRNKEPKQYLESLSYFGIDLKNSVFQVALTEIKWDDRDISEEEKMLTKMYARKIIEDYYGGYSGIYICDSGADYIILVNNESETLLYDHSDDLKKYLENNMEFQVCIGVGNAYTELERLRESYQEAKDSLKYQFVSGIESVICFRDVYPYHDAKYMNAMCEDAIHELGNAIRISAYAEAEKILNEMLERLKGVEDVREEVLILAIKVLTEIMKILTELKIEIQLDDRSFSEKIEYVFALNTFEAMKEYLELTVREACENIGAEISDKEKNLIRKVTDYINEHYSEEDLSLNTLAQLYYVNASYLSRIFKEKMGDTFTGYIFTIRMKEAEKLILTTDMKAYEIAEKIGISDPHYFSSCFKKYAGMSVSEYKKNRIAK